MKTDDLIKLIAQDAAAPRPSLERRLLTATVLGGLAAAAALLATIGIRPDVVSALGTWRFDAKLASVALTLLASWLAARRLSSPQADPAGAARYALAPLALLATTIIVELASSPSATWSARAVGSNSILCLFAIVAFAAAPFVILMAAMRTGAPRSPTLAGAAAGLLAGAIGALFYAIHCPDDSPLFVALWYSPPVLAMATLGAALGRPALRW